MHTFFTRRNAHLLAFVTLTPLLVSQSFAGPVNSSSSHGPFAQMNAAGDYLLAGDLKISVRWNGLVNAFLSGKEVSPRETLSGGIADRSRLLPNKPAAVACSHHTAHLFYSETFARPAHVAWKPFPGIEAGDLSRDEIRCAISARGVAAVLLLKSGKVLLDGVKSLILPPGFRPQHFISAGESFLALGEQRKGVWINTDGSTSGEVELPSVLEEENTRFVGNASGILKADANGVELWPLEQPGDARFPTITVANKMRLPVAPCSDSQMCGASLAVDGSWAVSGSWGTYVGKNKSFLRVPVPNFGGESAGIAFAHQGNGGEFVYAGSDDGDLGTLPVVNAAPQATGAPFFQTSGRWAVWLKGAAVEQEKATRLFSYKDAHGIYGDVIIHKGTLPDPIPDNWAAFEPEITFSTPALPFESSLELELASEVPYWAAAIKRDEAWEQADAKNTAPAPIKVSVIDSGANTRHEMLQSALFKNPQEIPGNEIDDDRNGFVDDVNGFDFVDEDADPQDIFGHGTHVAGLVAARGQSKNFAPGRNAQLVILRALDSNGKSNSIDLARSLAYAADSGSQIVNCSWGGGASTQALRDAFAYLESQSVLVISSSGNDGLNTDKFPEVPKIYPGVVSVGSLNARGTLAQKSNYGEKSVAWLVPGDSVLSTLTNGTMGSKSGTSMAAGLASGMTAWVMGIYMAINPDAMKAEVKREVQKLMCDSGSHNEVRGKSVCGKIDLLSATQAALKEEVRH